MMPETYKLIIFYRMFLRDICMVYDCFGDIYICIR